MRRKKGNRRISSGSHRRSLMIVNAMLVSVNSECCVVDRSCDSRVQWIAGVRFTQPAVRQLQPVPLR